MNKNSRCYRCGYRSNMQQISENELGIVCHKIEQLTDPEYTGEKDYLGRDLIKEYGECDLFIIDDRW